MCFSSKVMVKDRFLQSGGTLSQSLENMYMRSLTVMYYFCHQVYCICHHVQQEPHCVTTFALKCTAYPIMDTRSHTGVYYISHQVYYRGHRVQEPHLGVLHFPSSVLHILSCTSGASLNVHQEPHLVYCIYQQVYCICHHLQQEAHLGVLLLPSSVLQRPWCTSGASRVYCICHQVYCISYHVYQEPHLVYCICHQVYCMCICHHVQQEPHWDYYICPQVCCISHHVHQEPHLGVLHWPTSVLHVHMPSCNSGASRVYYISHQVYYRVHHVIQEPHGCTTEAIMYFRSLALGVLHLPTDALHLP